MPSATSASSRAVRVLLPADHSGPRSADDQLAHQLYAEHRYSFDNIRSGARDPLGLFQKLVIIADRAVGMIHTVAGAYTTTPARMCCWQRSCTRCSCMPTSPAASTFHAAWRRCSASPWAKTVLLAHAHRVLAPLAHFLGDWLRNYLFYPLSISKAFLNWGRHAKQHLGNHIGKVAPRCTFHHRPLARGKLSNGMNVSTSATRSSPRCTLSARARGIRCFPCCARLWSC